MAWPAVTLRRRARTGSRPPAFIHSTTNPSAEATVTSTASSARDQRRCRPPPGTSAGAGRPGPVGVGRREASSRTSCPAPSPRPRRSARPAVGVSAAGPAVGPRRHRRAAAPCRPPSSFVLAGFGPGGIGNRLGAIRATPIVEQHHAAVVHGRTRDLGGGHRRRRRHRWRWRSRRRQAAGIVGKLEPPAGVDEVGVGQAAPVGLDLALVQPEDLLPAEGIAEVSLGDVPQRVAALHLVGRRRGASGRRPRHRLEPPRPRAARRPPESPAAETWAVPVPADRTRPTQTAPWWRGAIPGERSWRSAGLRPAAGRPRTALRRPCGPARRRRPRRAATPRARSRPTSRRPPGPSPGTRRGCRCRAARHRSATASGPPSAAASPPTRSGHRHPDDEDRHAGQRRESTAGIRPPVRPVELQVGTHVRVTVPQQPVSIMRRPQMMPPRCGRSGRRLPRRAMRSRRARPPRCGRAGSAAAPRGATRRSTARRRRRSGRGRACRRRRSPSRPSTSWSPGSPMAIRCRSPSMRMLRTIRSLPATASGRYTPTVGQPSPSGSPSTWTAPWLRRRCGRLVLRAVGPIAVVRRQRPAHQEEQARRPEADRRQHGNPARHAARGPGLGPGRARTEGPGGARWLPTVGAPPAAGPGTRMSPAGTAVRRARARSSAEAKRRSGSRSMARSTTAASGSGTCVRLSSRRCRPASAARTTANGTGPVYGGCPASAW